MLHLKLYYVTEYPYKQIACAPPGTQACAFDIAKFHCTCPVIPAHKPWLVVQGTPGQFYLDHVHPFGSTAASSNAGMISNAIVDIWQALGVKPTLKYEDDLKYSANHSQLPQQPIPTLTFQNTSTTEKKHYDISHPSPSLGTKKKATRNSTIKLHL